MPNHILEYQLSTPENVDVVVMYRKKKETSFFDPHLTPGDKMKIPKPYCTSTRHSQSNQRVSIVYYMKCRQNSSDNNFTKNVIFWPLIDPSLTKKNYSKL